VGRSVGEASGVEVMSNKGSGRRRKLDQGVKRRKNETLSVSLCGCGCGWVGGGGVFRNDRLAPLWKSLLRFSCVRVVGPMISSRT
jgi:hypothetical protein